MRKAHLWGHADQGLGKIPIYLQDRSGRRFHSGFPHPMKIVPKASVTFRKKRYSNLEKHKHHILIPTVKQYPCFYAFADNQTGRCSLWCPWARIWGDTEPAKPHGPDALERENTGRGCWR
jgi:hypothetical protein